MIRGLYQAAAGMKARLAAQDIIANNLANAGTTGFQREIASVQARLVAAPVAPGAPFPGVALSRPPVELMRTVSGEDRRQGALQQTGVDTDLALDGPGYFVVQTTGGPRLYRGGSLRSNPQGNLATPGGDALLGTGGRPIRVAGKAWLIGPDGTVTVDGAAVGRLRVARPTGPVRREGGTLLSSSGVQDVPAGTTRVLQGTLEHANVDAVREMVDMIAGFRAYESSQRAVLAQDETLQNLFDVLRKG